MTVRWKPREDSPPALSVIQWNQGRWQVIFRTFPVRMDGPPFEPIVKILNGDKKRVSVILFHFKNFQYFLTVKG
jgi:hypothetical protein